MANIAGSIASLFAKGASLLARKVSDKEETFGKAFRSLILFGPDAALSLQGEDSGFIYQPDGGLVATTPGQLHLSGESYQGAVVSSGITLTVENYYKTIGGTLAGAVNLDPGAKCGYDLQIQNLYSDSWNK